MAKNIGGLRFRDLKVFNQAMLAKQGWRLLHNGDTPLTNVLKERYFSHSNFLNAALGYRPSFVWRSIGGAKTLLLEGVRWRVGIGPNIYVW